MGKIALFMTLIAIVAIAISRRMRLSQRYERNSRTISPWNSLDKGIDPTDTTKDSQ